jgi:hypothetical protein
VDIRQLNQMAELSEAAEIDRQPPAGALAGCAYIGGLRTRSNAFL